MDTIGTALGQGFGTTTTTSRVGLRAIDTAMDAIGTVIGQGLGNAIGREVAMAARRYTMKSPTPSLDTISNSRTASLGQLRAVCMHFVADVAFEIEGDAIAITYPQSDMVAKIKQQLRVCKSTVVFCSLISKIL